MPTIVDSLVVSLGSDPSCLTSGTRNAQEDYKRLRDDATRTGRDLSEAGKRGSEFFVKMRNEALAFFAVFTAGKGLKAFVSDTVSSNVALGNLSRNLNTNARTLDAWQRTARSFGASAGSVAGLYQSIQGMSQTYSGRLDLSRLQSLTGVSFIDQTTGKLKSLDTIMAQLNRTAQGMDAGRFQAIIGMLGGGQDAATVLEQSTGTLQSRLRQMLRYAVTPQDVQSSQALLADWVRLTSQSEQLGRSFLTHVEPGFHAVLKNLSDWIDKHPEFQRTLDRDGDAIARFLASIDWNKVSKAVDELEQKIEGLPWKGIATDLSALKGDFAELTKLTGGWVNASELLFGLWAGSKFASMLAGVRLLSGLLSAGPIGALIGAAALPAIGAAAGYTLAKGGSPPIAPDTLAPAGSSATGAAAYFRSQGWSPQQTAGIVANLDAESGFNPSITGDHGTAYGIGQWHADRQAQFQKLFGRPIQGSSYAQQLAFVQWEMTHGAFKAAGDALKGAKTEREAGAVVSRLYERPAAADAEADKRAALAELWGARLALARVKTRPQRAGDRAGKAEHDAIVHRSQSAAFLGAFSNTDSPVVYSKALLDVAAHPGPVSNTTTHTTTIQQVHVHIKSTDPKGAAREVGSVLSRPQRLAAVGNTGLQ